MSARRWYGGALSSRKTVSPPFRPRTYPHLTPALDTEPRGLPEPPAVVIVEGESAERIVGQQEVAVEIDPIREGRGRGRGGDRNRCLLHAAEERPEAELAGAREHLGRGPGATALCELHVDAGGDADQGVEVLDRHARLVGDDRQRRALLELGEPCQAGGREGLLDQLDPELDQGRQQL